MNQIPDHRRWERLAAAARQARQELPPGDDEAPLGFASRVVARALEQRREWLAGLWQRWSWRAALLSATAALAVAFVATRNESRSGLEVPTSTLDVPSLSWP